MDLARAWNLTILRPGSHLRMPATGGSDRAAVRAAHLSPVGHLEGGTRVGPGALEDLREDLRGLGAGDAVLLVHDEERDTGGAVRPGLGDVCLDGVGEVVTHQH